MPGRRTTPEPDLRSGPLLVAPIGAFGPGLGPKKGSATGVTPACTTRIKVLDHLRPALSSD
jgi:hypothetical protein